jgi:3-hydroxyisobutyrate dehydrogenase-like beta-hydroxyacid dehydrogenase
MKVGFIGLGQMGTAMALNLIKAGHEVTVYNRSRDKAEALAGEGQGCGDRGGSLWRRSCLHHARA